VRERSARSNAVRYLVSVIALIVFPVFVVVSIIMEAVALRRGRQRIDRWASENHYQLQAVRRRWLRTGPWGFWFNGKTSRIFEVVVTDSVGGTRTVFAKVRGGFGGFVADVIDMRWVPATAG